MAKQSVRLKDILQLKVGDVMDFKRATTEPVDLVGNGKLVAKAELVLVDGKVGVRVLKLIK
jgi:flagellar motor switch protein FliN/FliY